VAPQKFNFLPNFCNIQQPQPTMTTSNTSNLEAPNWKTINETSGFF
jgi:hypothetical protein